MNDNYGLDEDGGLVDEDNNPIYCSAVGCETQACNLVGITDLPLCMGCADVWYMGFEAGKEIYNEKN